MIERLIGGGGQISASCDQEVNSMRPPWGDSNQKNLFSGVRGGIHWLVEKKLRQLGMMADSSSGDGPLGCPLASFTLGFKPQTSFSPPCSARRLAWAFMAHSTDIFEAMILCSHGVHWLFWAASRPICFSRDQKAQFNSPRQPQLNTVRLALRSQSPLSPTFGYEH